MVTAVGNERLEQRFRMWDVNENGVIERSDYEAEAKRIVSAFSESETSPKAVALLDAYLGMYDQMARWNGVEIDGHITKEQFIGYVTIKMTEQGDAGFNQVLRPTITAIVNLCDTDGDGQVSQSEFTLWLKAVGVPEEEVASAFRQLDTNGNGHLSVDELIQAVRDFHEGTSDVSLLGSR